MKQARVTAAVRADSEDSPLDRATIRAFAAQEKSGILREQGEVETAINTKVWREAGSERGTEGRRDGDGETHREGRNERERGTQRGGGGEEAEMEGGREGGTQRRSEQELTLMGISRTRTSAVTQYISRSSLSDVSVDPSP